MRARQKQDQLCSSDVPEGTGFKWLGRLSKLEIMWVLAGLAGLLFCSVYITETLKSKIPTTPELSGQLEFIQTGIYSIAALGVALLVAGVLLISRRSVSQFVDTSDRQDESSLIEKSSTLTPTIDDLSHQDDLSTFYDVLDTSPALVFTKDADLNYTFANKQWLQTFNLTLEEVVGKSHLEVFGDNEYFQNRAESEKQALQGHSTVDVEENIATDQGDMIVLSNILPFKQGSVSTLISWSTDITYLRRDFDELEQARQQADSSNQAKSSFLATMSHEIRTPMNGVVGSLDLLRVSELDDSQRQLIDTINESAFALLTIIDDILDFSKIESGKLNLENVPVSFERLLGSVAASLIPNAQQKGVELLIYADSKIPDVYADLVRLRQIVSNLGSNAIKFTAGKDGDKGRVIVRCMLSSMDDSGNTTINISVEDNGIGISEEAQAQLFQPFIQAEGSTTRRFGGSGLGLSITSRLTEMMNGQIGVRSRLGEGAVFTAVIPFTAVPDSDGQVRESTLSGVPVLFVKGEHSVNELFLSHLKNEGMPCYEVSRLQEEWSQVSIDHNGQLVIIIVDCWANDLGVPALKRELEEQFSYIDKLSFLILSQGYLMEPQLQTENTTKLDYNGLGRQAFIKAIDVLVNKSSNSRVRTIAAQAAADKNGKSLAELNADKLLLLAEDNEVNQKVLKHQLGVLGYPVEIANDGAEALELWMENKEKYQLILTDCHMPNLDGYGLASAVREEEKEGKRIPIIAITADALQGTDEQCKQAGMDDYLTKPLLISDLSAKLEKWLDTLDVVAESTDPNQSEMREGNDHIGETGEIDSKGVEQREEDVELVNPETLIGFLGTSTYSTLREFFLQYLRSSELTVETMSDLSSQNGSESVPEIAKLAHKLKSSSYAIGAKILGDTCLALENMAKQSDDVQMQDCKALIAQLVSQYGDVEAWIEENYSSDEPVASV